LSDNTSILHALGFKTKSHRTNVDSEWPDNLT
jgi:hypothetical protein